MQPIRVTKGPLVTASSTLFGVLSSAAGSVGAGSSLSTFLSTIVLDTARRIIVWGSTSIATPITITGISEGGFTVSETIFGSTTAGTATETTVDFLQLTSVSISTAGVTSTGWYVGTSSHAGTPWKLVDFWPNPPSVNFQLTPSSSIVAVSLEYTFDAISYPWINPTSTSTGTNWRSGAPFPIVSSVGSTATAVTQSVLPFTPHAWRITLTSCSSQVGSAWATVIQSG
jgi:hypothetical protein